MTLHTWLTLGRVSNLPSIWSNILAAALVAQATLHEGFKAPIEPTPQELALSSEILWLGTVFSLSLMYLGGMFLNDAFDADWDKQHGIARPIATGRAELRSVWHHGFIMLSVGMMSIAYLAYAHANEQMASALSSWLSAGALVSCILLYNYSHKRFVLAPVLMGACRMLVYLIAALMLSNLTLPLLFAALGLCLFICGVTYYAKQEHSNEISRYSLLSLLFSPILLTLPAGYSHVFFWCMACGFAGYVCIHIRRHLTLEQPNIGAFIGSLLAAIPLIDALALASINQIYPSLICLAIFALMPALQRWIAAT